MFIFTRLMKGTRTIKSWIAYGLAPLLLIVLSISVYRQITDQPDLPQALNHVRQSFFSSSIILLIAALLGTYANWGLEALKWKRLMQQTQRISFTEAFRGVLTGVSFTLFTPNRIGEYLGRIWHLSAQSRGAAVSLSVAGGLAQLFTTALGGMIAYEYLRSGGFQLPLLPDTAYAYIPFQWLGWSVTVLLFVIYFNMGEAGIFLSRLRWLRSVQSWVQALVQLSKSELVEILLLSFLRYMVFLIQYFLLFQFFGVEISLSIAFIAIAFVFLSMALIPAMALADLGLRGQLSIWIVGAFSTNSLGIVLTTTTVWFINLILPAIVGGVLMVKRRETVIER